MNGHLVSEVLYWSEVQGTGKSAVKCAGNGERRESEDWREQGRQTGSNPAFSSQGAWAFWLPWYPNYCSLIVAEIGFSRWFYWLLNENMVILDVSRFCSDNQCTRSTHNMIQLIIMPVLKPSSNWNIYLYREHILKNLRRGLSALDYCLACFGHSAIFPRITSIGKRGHGVIRHPDGLQSGYD